MTEPKKRGCPFGPRAPGIKRALAEIAAHLRAGKPVEWRIEGGKRAGIFATAATANDRTPQQIHEAWRKYRHLPEYAL